MTKFVYNPLIISFFLVISLPLYPCTNFLVSKGATSDGSTMITYAADSHVLYGELYYIPAGVHASGSLVDVYEWDTGLFLGKIAQVAKTYSVVGNINEHQLAIGETTFGGRKELQEQPGAVIDYGSLMYLTLQRAKTAREAIQVMAELVSIYGYYSSGESFSISDHEEVWILEMIGKGKSEKGAVWVAMRIPDGYISGHANQARITTFPLNDPENCLFSPDVISFARSMGWFTGTDQEFSFSDVYAPVDFSAARFSDARVWAGFRKVCSGLEKHETYVQGKIQRGKHGYASNRLPLWVKPDKPLNVHQVMEMMRDHFTGTSLDMTRDLGAGPFGLPYRWRPLTWKVDSLEYCNERAISTQQTGFSFVAQSRAYLPDPIGGILWFGVDDTYSTCYVPMYCGINKVPEPFAVGNGDMLTYSETSAFWLFNQVANQAYLRYHVMIEDIRKVQRELETLMIGTVPAIDKAALSFWEQGNPKSGIDFLTQYSASTSDMVMKQWRSLSQYLLVKYKDGNIMKEQDGRFLRTSSGLPAYPDMPGYPVEWYRKIVEQTKSHFQVIEQ